jgi:hypothetical protein
MPMTRTVQRPQVNLGLLRDSKIQKAEKTGSMMDLSGFQLDLPLLAEGMLMEDLIGTFNIRTGRIGIDIQEDISDENRKAYRLRG